VIQRAQFIYFLLLPPADLLLHNQYNESAILLKHSVVDSEHLSIVYACHLKS